MQQVLLLTVLGALHVTSLQVAGATSRLLDCLAQVAIRWLKDQGAGVAQEARHKTTINIPAC